MKSFKEYLLEDKKTINYYKDQGGKIKANLKMKRYGKDYIFFEWVLKPVHC